MEPSPPTRPPPAPRRGYLVPGAIALVVIGGLAAGFGVLGLTSHAPTTLGGPQVAQSIAEDLQTGADAPTVTCPAQEPVRAGLVFTCLLVRPHLAAEPIRVTETGHGDFRFAPGVPPARG